MIVPPITAISGAFSSVNTIFQWVGFYDKTKQEFKKLPKHFQHYAVCLVEESSELERWELFWGLNKNNNYDDQAYHRKLWGTMKGLQAIYLCHDDIQDQFKDISNEIDKYIDKEVSKRSALKVRFRSNGASHSSAAQKEGSSDVERAAKYPNKLKAVFFSALSRRSGIEESMETLKLSIKNLCEISDRAFKAIHGPDLLERIQKEKIKVLDTYTDLLLDQIDLHRPCSRYFYDKYISIYHDNDDTLSPGRLSLGRLGMDLFGEDTNAEGDRSTAQYSYNVIRNSSLRYHFVLDSEDQLLELSAQGPYGSNPIAKLDPHVQFHELYKFFRAGKQASGHRTIKVFKFNRPDNVESWFFRFCSPPDINPYINETQTPWVDVTSLLYRSKGAVYGKLRYSDRLCLAIYIVECGLLLSGTPWMEGFNSGRLERGPKDELLLHRYIFKIPVSSSLKGDEFQDIQDHFCRIGKTLVAIGLGKQIVDEKFEDDSKMTKIYLLRKIGKDGELEFDEGEWQTALEIKNDLVVEFLMGDGYASATEYCLLGGDSSLYEVGGSSANCLEALRQIMKGYYMCVFSPMRILRKDLRKRAYAESKRVRFV